MGDGGTGADGDLTVASGATFNISTDGQNSKDGCSDGGDGVSYLLTNLTGASATLHRKPGPTCLSVGDEVMLINLMSRSNKHPNVGNYEFLRVGSVDVQKQTVYFTTAKTRSYGEDASKDTNIGFSAGQQVVALVRVPNYHNVTISGSLTANAFEAPTSAFGQGVGGVIVFRASGVLQGVGLIDARNLGYHGGAMGASGNCGESANGPTSGGCNGGGGAAINANLTLQNQLYLGAGGGGNSTTVGARGGGIVYITGRTVKQRTGDANPPSIYVKGQNGGAAGAGAGGSIYLLGDSIDINSLLVSGGTSSTGNGDAGFSAVYYDLTFSGPTPGYLEDTSPATPTITKTPTLGPSPTVTRTPTVNGLPSTVSYAYNSSRPHAVTSLSNGNSYTYDANGNTLTRTVDGITTTFVYDGNNRVTSANNPSTNEVYWYDGDGTRVAKLVNNTTLSMYFAGGSYEVTGSLNGGTFTTISTRKYYALGGASIMDDNGTLRYTLSDQQGSTVAVLSDTGTVVSQQRYMPFGQVRVDVGSITQTDFGYTGQRNMSSIGLMDYKARFYDQSLGRFIQPDTIVSNPASPQTWNRYSYVENDPINWVDPTGHTAADWNCNSLDSNDTYAQAGCTAATPWVDGEGEQEIRDAVAKRQQELEVQYWADVANGKKDGCVAGGIYKECHHHFTLIGGKKQIVPFLTTLGDSGHYADPGVESFIATELTNFDPTMITGQVANIMALRQQIYDKGVRETYQKVSNSLLAYDDQETKLKDLELHVLYHYSVRGDNKYTEETVSLIMCVGTCSTSYSIDLVGPDAATMNNWMNGVVP